MGTGQICRYPSPPVFAFFITQRAIEESQRATEFFNHPQLERGYLAGSGLNLFFCRSDYVITNPTDQNHKYNLNPVP